jgi:NADH:ubiquinone oxidoreductase subunit 2 (subunit N)
VATDNNDTALTFFLLKVVHTMLFFKIFNSVFYHMNVGNIFLFIACIILIAGSVFLWIEETMHRIIACLAAYNFGISLMLCTNNGLTATKGSIMLFLSEILCLLGFFVFLAKIKKSNTAVLEIQQKCSLDSGEVKTVQDCWTPIPEKCAFFAVPIPTFFLSLTALQPILGTFAKFYACVSLLENEYMLPFVIFLVTDCVRIICLAKMLQKIWLEEPDQTA